MLTIISVFKLGGATETLPLYVSNITFFEVGGGGISFSLVVILVETTLQGNDIIGNTSTCTMYASIPLITWATYSP